MAAYWCKFFNFLHSTKCKQFQRYYVNGWSKQQFLYPVVGIVREADSGASAVASLFSRRATQIKHMVVFVHCQLDKIPIRVRLELSLLGKNV